MGHHHEERFEPGAYSAAVLIASTKGARGEREDKVGPMLEEKLRDEGFEIDSVKVVTDDEKEIAGQLEAWVGRGIRLILTSGGTGLTPGDVTPEATRLVIEREVPGLAEAIRAAGRPKTPHADLSRGLAGTARQSLIINLPGSPKGAMEGLETVLPALPHALDKIKGDPTDCAPA